MKLKLLFTALLLTASASSTGGSANAAPSPAVTPAPAVTASDAWIALGPPGSSPLAGYLTLANSGAKPAALVGVDSPAFDAIELHSTVADGSTMRMRRLTRLDVPAGGRVALGPGRLHLMLFGPRLALAAGQHVDLELSFDDGTTLVVDAEVRDPRDASAAPLHHDGMH